MIVYSAKKREIGTVETPEYILDYHSNRIYGQPVLIIREATHQEWFDDVIANGGIPRCYEESPFYYEVHTD